MNWCAQYWPVQVMPCKEFYKCKSSISAIQMESDGIKGFRVMVPLESKQCKVNSNGTILDMDQVT